jgi:hypothetical protein
MNQPNLLDDYISDISEEATKFCDNLLALAEWLDSQNDYFVSDFNHSRDAFKLVHLKTDPEKIRHVFGVDADIYHNFYAQSSTNSERVLAVLMLRSAILAGDSFV